MHIDALQVYRCPGCGGSLSSGGEVPGLGSGGEEGTLKCGGCQRTFPIRGGVPRFVPASNYAESFGFQWNRFSGTQLDSRSGLDITRRRFLAQTGWPIDALRDARVLDVGCGAGRFAEVALSLGAVVHAVDYSGAVDACWRNLGGHPRLHVAQADMYRLPFAPACFDFVYCFGVLQHTPDPAKAFAALPQMLKPGGRIAIDVYRRRWTSTLEPKYWLRFVTARRPKERLFASVERWVPRLLPISRAFARIPVAGRFLRRLVPVANYQGIHPLSESQLREWAVLDTFDWLSPAYDQPQTLATVARWLHDAGLDAIEVVHVAHLVGRGRRPAA